MNNVAVADVVRPYLEHHSVNGITFDVVPDKIRKIDNWWRVPIRPSQWPERVFPLYEVLAEIEDELRDNNHLDILLSLGEPDSSVQQ